jgi:ubiquinone/menaquinone biosynthesis C-methylase UbiE/uncharacterized protein YbaR (Trm112 family)
MKAAQAALLRCPRCAGELRFSGSRRGGELMDGSLACAACRAGWPVRGGRPAILDAAKVRGVEWLIRMVYDVIAPFHDPAVHYLLPIFMGASEEEARRRYLARLALSEIVPRPGEPIRVLDVGVGGGADLALIARDLPAGVDAELWGLDYSPRMLAQCDRRLRGWSGPPVHLLLGDAHALPFPEASFDRVLHVGGIATYRDPARALAEMARVAKPGTPIVVVDEQLDGAANWVQWLAFKSMTLYDLSPHAPIEHLPPEAVEVRVEQASLFFYALSFRVGAG